MRPAKDMYAEAQRETARILRKEKERILQADRSKEIPVYVPPPEKRGFLRS